MLLKLMLSFLLINYVILNDESIQFEYVIIFFLVPNRGGCYIWREYGVYLQVHAYDAKDQLRSLNIYVPCRLKSWIII